MLKRGAPLSAEEDELQNAKQSYMRAQKCLRYRGRECVHFYENLAGKPRATIDRHGRRRQNSHRNEEEDRITERDDAENDNGGEQLSKARPQGYKNDGDGTGKPTPNGTEIQEKEPTNHEKNHRETYTSSRISAERTKRPSTLAQVLNMDSEYGAVGTISVPCLSKWGHSDLIAFETKYAKYIRMIDDINSNRFEEDQISMISIRDCINGPNLHTLCLLGESEGATSVGESRRGSKLLLPSRLEDCQSVSRLR